MTILLGNLGNIFSSILNWSTQMASSLITNPIFIILMAVIILILFIDLLVNLINDSKAKKLATELTGGTSELEYYRSLSEEEKEEYNRTHI